MVEVQTEGLGRGHTLHLVEPRSAGMHLGRTVRVPAWPTASHGDSGGSLRKWVQALAAEHVRCGSMKHQS